MFYQNNNDYMRDAFYYSVPQNATYQNGCVSGFTPMNNIQTPMFQNGVVPANTIGNNMLNNQMTNPMLTSQNMQRTPISSMYPQVYKIINPVANRVISNSNYQFLTEDTLNNMVDTVYNIVEGDFSTLSSTTPMNSEDNPITQGSSRGTAQTTTTSTTSNSSGNSRQTTVTESNRNASATVISQNSRNRGENQLLRDLIKIIIIKELLSRQMGGFAIENTANNQMNNSNFMGYSNNPNNFYDSRVLGLI